MQMPGQLWNTSVGQAPTAAARAVAAHLVARPWDLGLLHQLLLLLAALPDAPAVVQLLCALAEPGVVRAIAREALVRAFCNAPQLTNTYCKPCSEHDGARGGTRVGAAQPRPA